MRGGGREPGREGEAGSEGGVRMEGGSCMG